MVDLPQPSKSRPCSKPMLSMNCGSLHSASWSLCLLQTPRQSSSPGRVLRRWTGGEPGSPPDNRWCIDRLCRVRKILFFQQFNRCQRSRAGNGIAAIGIPVRALGPCHHRFARDTCAQRQTRCNAFCRGDNIRFDAKVLDRPPFTGAPHTALYFICDQQDAIFITQFAQAQGKIHLAGRVSAFALDRFHKNASDLIARDIVTKDFLFDKRTTVSP